MLGSRWRRRCRRRSRDGDRRPRCAAIGGNVRRVGAPVRSPPLRGTTVVCRRSTPTVRAWRNSQRWSTSDCWSSRHHRVPFSAPPGRSHHGRAGRPPRPSGPGSRTAKYMPTEHGTQRASSLPVRHVNDRGPPPTCRLARWGSPFALTRGAPAAETTDPRDRWSSAVTLRRTGWPRSVVAAESTANAAPIGTPPAFVDVATRPPRPHLTETGNAR